MLWQGVLWKLLPRRGAAAGAPRPPLVRGFGRERPRPGTGTAPLPERVGAGLRKPRGQKDKGAARSGGRQGRKDREREGCYARYAIYCFISPGYRVRKTKNRNRRAVIHVRYFCLPTSPGVSPLGFPCQHPDVPDGEKPLCPRWRGGHRSQSYGCPARASVCHRAESE